MAMKPENRLTGCITAVHSDIVTIRFVVLFYDFFAGINHLLKRYGFVRIGFKIILLVFRKIIQIFFGLMSLRSFPLSLFYPAKPVEIFRQRLS